MDFLWRRVRASTYDTILKTSFTNDTIFKRQYFIFKKKNTTTKIDDIEKRHYAKNHNKCTYDNILGKLNFLLKIKLYTKKTTIDER